MKIFEVTKIKDRVKKAIDRLDDNDPLLIHVKNALFDAVLQKQLEDSSITNKARDQAVAWFKSKLEALRVPLEEKIKLLKLMDDPSNLIPSAMYESNTNGNVLSHLSQKIQKNKAFKEIATPTWRYKIGGQGGMGPGELFLLLFSADGHEGSGKKGGDVEVGNWKVEVKLAGVVPPGDSGNKIVDSLNNNLVKQSKQLGFDTLLFDNDKGIGPTSFESGWFPNWFKFYALETSDDESKQQFSKYLNSLYEGIPEDIVNKMYLELGSSDASKTLAPYIFEMYKKSHGWNSICMVDENFNFVNLVSFENIPNNVQTNIKLKRGGDTNAVADGYMIVTLSDKTDKTTRQTASTKKEKTTKVKPIEKPIELPKDRTVINQTIKADDRFIEALRDPANPLTVAWRGIDSADKAEAKEIILDMMLSGKSDEEIAKDINNELYESQLAKMKTLLFTNL